MTSKQIADRKDYLESMRSDLSLNENLMVITEMSKRVRRIEYIYKSLVSASINADNIPGINIYTRITKNKVVAAYLEDYFFFDTIKLSSTASDKILVAEANLFKFAKGIGITSTDSKAPTMMKKEFAKVEELILAGLSYSQVDYITTSVEEDKGTIKMYIRLHPSDTYKNDLKSVNFISHEKFFK